jgi:hypothetical protein
MNNINNYEEQEKAIKVLYAHGNKILISDEINYQIVESFGEDILIQHKGV